MKCSKKLIKAAAAAALICGLLSACGTAQESVSETENAPTPRTAGIKTAQACAKDEIIELPVLLRAPQRDGTCMTLLSGNVLGGAFTTVSSCSTRDLITQGELTVQVCAVSQKDRDASFALWKLTEDASEYVESVSFPCDGETHGYRFAPLDSNAQYRVVFSGDDGRARMSGTFAVQGVTAEVEEPEQEETTNS